MHDVSIEHEVVFAFSAHFSGLSRFHFAAVVGVVLVGDDLSTDKAALEV